ncbi:PP2C family protein-serine/threonine phosphatase [Desulfobacter curvatus]|uniref:PP2C family protein-serine/threonine phosphatase n=1 Tax=Desulfobacter curvatus TaxID=2290 RepID=UPI00036C71E5|nr:PP2C family protein-serine/threonine phosphatase [Desulfobacter curvatus]
MVIENLTHDRLTALEFAGITPEPVILELLNSWAMAQDNDINLDLLKSLIVRYAELEKKVSRLNQDLAEKQANLDESLSAAAEIQKNFLPKNLPDIKGIEFAWHYKPSKYIAGDIFNLFRLDENHLGAYMVDVSGHGVPSALVSISVFQRLLPQSGLVKKSQSGSSYEIITPKAVINALDHEYPTERFDKFFTIIYLVLNTKTGNLIYCNAAHPPQILIRANGDLDLLDKGGSIIGMEGLVPFEQENKILRSGDKLLLYTDGLIEHRGRQGEFFGFDRLLALVDELKKLPVKEMLANLYDALMAFGDGSLPADDISLMGICYKSDCFSGNGR